MKYIIFLTLTLVVTLGTTNLKADDPIQTVPFVEIEKYMGTWYEIARYDNNFQRRCKAVRATYTLKKKYIKVLNECTRKDKQKKIKRAKGIAYIKDKETNVKLRVSFAPLFKYLGLFAGDYWIMELGSDYESEIFRPLTFLQIKFNRL